MVRRLVLFLSTIGLVAVPALAGAAPAAAGAAAARPYTVKVAQSTFSPNRDGVRDEVRVTYTLEERTAARLEVVRPFEDRVWRTVDLGVQDSGTYTWSWDGRDDRGRVVRNGMYWVRLVLPHDTAASRVPYDRVKVDTFLELSLDAPTYGVPHSVAAPRVFPRTTVVRDVLEIRGSAYEPLVASLELVIRSSSGAVVRRADMNRPVRFGLGGVSSRARTVRWTARRGGEALPRGRYSAVLKGRDRAGNRGRVALRIWVSGDKLVWRESTTTVTPAESDFHPCTYSSANGCGDVVYCGSVVDSSMFAGGLSHRSKTCEGAPESPLSLAPRAHLLEVPEAAGVRGLAAVRVGFTGAPTHAGETDTGVLRVWGAGDHEVVGTSGQSAWVEHPSWGEGDTGDPDRSIPQLDPAAAWSFTTEGTDAVDVASYTVDVRYLAVAD